MKNVLFPALLFFLFATLSVLAQTSVKNTAPLTSKMRLLGKTPALRDISPLTIPSDGRRKHGREVPQRIKAVPTKYPETNPRNGDPLARAHAQDLREGSLVVEPKQLFEGITYTDIAPPDPTGAVGRNHFVTIVNSASGATMKIFDKQGNNLYGPASISNLWSTFGENGLGDGIVLYDQLADRWLISELAGSFSNKLLVAVSITPDPLGDWNVYEFQTFDFPDYPKYTLWNNAYLVTTNEFGDNQDPVYALDRTAMLNGAPTANIQRFGVEKFQAGEFELLSTPSLGGFNLPNGDAAYALRLYDNAWNGGADKIELWEIAINWANADLSEITGPIELFTAPFESSVCVGWNVCIEQPDGSKISAMQQIIMNHPVYRNYGTYEAIVLQHVVDVDGADRAGIRWYELRRLAGGNWEIAKEGTHTEDDNSSRFMGSISLDGGGNIGMIYSVAGPDKFPSLHYTGCLSGNSSGEMDVINYEFAAGAGNMDFERYGDYSQISVDPMDDRTFWAVGEYMPEDVLWSTKVVAFELKRDTNDVGVQTLLAPQSSHTLDNNESITAIIRNYGYAEQSNFEVSYQIDNGVVVTEMINAVIPPDGVYEHTFVPTGDFSIIGQHYSVKLFTNLNTDTNHLNDTLVKDVYKIPTRDATPYIVIGLDAVNCSDQAIVVVGIKNLGGVPLTEFDLLYQVNGGTTETYHYTGNLLPNATVDISLNLVNLIDGTNTFSCSTANPNNDTDQNTGNDYFVKEFPVSLYGVTLYIDMSLDQYPEETSWEITDDLGNIIISGDNYGWTNLEVHEEVCVPDNACYTFTIHDSYGDGMWGTFGVTDENGNIFVETTDFWDIYSTPFCIEDGCNLIADATIEPCSNPNTNNGSITILADHYILPIVFSMNGVEYTEFSPIHVFDNLAVGTYTITITDAMGCSTTITETVGTQVGITPIELSNVLTISPNPAKGIISLDIKGMSGVDFLSIEVLNANGQVINRPQLVRYGDRLHTVLVLGNNPPGMYFIAYDTPRGKQIAKLVYAGK